VVLAPFAVWGVLVCAMWPASLLRYDPDYFTPSLRLRYHSPSVVAEALEQALRRDDAALLAELQGLRQPAHLDADPSLELVMVWGRTDGYTTYQYVDARTREQRLYTMEKVRGRWVVAPDDIYSSIRSGHAARSLLPAAVVWWALGLGALVVRLLARRFPRLGARLSGL
jgi:hypothetical protein